MQAGKSKRGQSCQSRIMPGNARPGSWPGLEIYVCRYDTDKGVFSVIISKEISLIRATVSELTAVKVMTDSCHGIGTALPLPASAHRLYSTPMGKFPNE